MGVFLSIKRYELYKWQHSVHVSDWSDNFAVTGAEKIP